MFKMSLKELLDLIESRRGVEVTQSDSSDIRLIDATGGMICQAYDSRGHARIYSSHPHDYFLNEVRENNWVLKAWDRWERVNGGEPFEVTFA